MKLYTVCLQKKLNFNKNIERKKVTIWEYVRLSLARRQLAPSGLPCRTTLIRRDRAHYVANSSPVGGQNLCVTDEVCLKFCGNDFLWIWAIYDLNKIKINIFVKKDASVKNKFVKSFKMKILCWLPIYF